MCHLDGIKVQLCRVINTEILNRTVCSRLKVLKGEI